MENKSLKPKIRFKGFTEAWEQRKFSDVGCVSMCKRIFKTQTTDIGEVPFFKIGTFGKTADSYITKKLFNEYKAKFSYPEKGDILISASGSIGRIVEFSGKDEYFQDSNIVWLKHNKEISNEFLKQLYQIVKWYGIEGTTIQRLYNSNILNTEFKMPSIDEQNKISSLLNCIDNLITLHQRKCDKLVNIKKSLLEKMFPKNGNNVPEIRFKGFTEAWEQRKLSEIATMHARIGWQNLRKNEFLDSGKYLLITGTDFENGEINYSTCHYVEKERYIQDKNIQVENGSILITKDGTLGKVALVRKLPIPATLNAGVFNVKNNKILSDNKYVFQYLKAPFLMNYVLQNATGGTIKHLNQNILVDFIVKMPNIDEQSKIGEFLDCIDNLITLHQKKLNKLKNIKKSLLDKMFV